MIAVFFFPFGAVSNSFHKKNNIIQKQIQFKPTDAVDLYSSTILAHSAVAMDASMYGFSIGVRLSVSCLWQPT